MEPSGFIFKGKGNRTAACDNCINTLNLKTSVGNRPNSGHIADEFCVLCGENITGPGTIDNFNDRQIDYSTGLLVLIDNQFESAHPIPDSTGNVKEISPGVKKSVAQRTRHDPVIVKVFPDQSQLLSSLQEFAEKSSQLGPVRGYTEDYTDEDGNVTGYDVIFFSVQS